MKKLLLLFIIGCSLFSCTPKTVKQGSKFTRADKEVKLTDGEVIPQSNLESYLNRVGIQVVGIGSNAHLDPPSRRPIFVINGNEVGDSYAVAFDIVRDKKIKSLRFLKEIHEKGQYGWRGQYGVIVIKTD